MIVDREGSWWGFTMHVAGAHASTLHVWQPSPRSQVLLYMCHGSALQAAG